MKKMLSVLFCLVAVLLCLTGCTSKKEAAPTAVCVVTAQRANSPVPDTSRFRDAVYQACISYGRISAVTVEGTPRMVCDFTVEQPDTWLDGQKRRQLAERYTETVLAAIAERAVADSAEADVLQAVTLAADILRSAPQPVKLLYIEDSLLGTAGLLDFASSNLIEQDPETVVRSLSEHYAVPDLTGVDVFISGMGQTCGEQSALGPTALHRHEEIVTAILRAAGAGSITVDRTPVMGSDTDAPHVSAVSVIREMLPFDAAEEAALNTAVIRIPEESVCFIENTARPADREAAAAYLTELAALLRENTGLHVVLAGSTATTGDADGAKALSLERAQAVRQLLTELGVDGGQLRCVGLGYGKNCLRVEDVGPDGRLIPEKAGLNRAVFVIREDSTAAEKVEK